MPKVHVLKSNNNKSYKLAIHFDTPAGNNTAGFSWKLVGLSSGDIGTTSLKVGTNPSDITQEEYDEIISGDVIEILRENKMDGLVADVRID